MTLMGHPLAILTAFEVFIVQDMRSAWQEDIIWSFHYIIIWKLQTSGDPTGPSDGSHENPLVNTSEVNDLWIILKQESKFYENIFNYHHSYFSLILSLASENLNLQSLPEHVIRGGISTPLKRSSKVICLCYANVLSYHRLTQVRSSPQQLPSPQCRYRTGYA